MSNINHPKHYNTGSIEVIDAIEDLKKAGVVSQARIKESRS